MLGNGQGVDNIAVGQNHFHGDAHVVDLAVFAGHDADAPVAQRAADGAAGQAGGDVLAGIAPLVGIPFQLLKDHARLGGDGAADLVDLDQMAHALHVHHDAARHGQRAALRTGAAAPDIHGNFIVIGDLQNFGDFLGAARADDDVGHGRGQAVIHPHTADPEIVHAVGSAVAVLGGDVLHAYDVLQLRADHIAHKGFAFHGDSPLYQYLISKFSPCRPGYAPRSTTPLLSGWAMSHLSCAHKRRPSPPLGFSCVRG